MPIIAPIVWAVGGHDPSGVAGIQADLATFYDFQLQACAIPTILTIQDSHKVSQLIFLESDFIRKQIENLSNDFFPRAIKMGALGKLEVVEILSRYLNNYKGQVIYDPVLASTSGSDLTDPQAYLSILKLLLPRVDVFTPNLLEASIFLNLKINTADDVMIAARKFLSMGCRAVVIKGGHFPTFFMHDYFSDGRRQFWLNVERIHQENVRGTGCRLSSAIAACLALGDDLTDALVRARFYLQSKIRQAVLVNQNTRIMINASFIEKSIDFPWISENFNDDHRSFEFPNCGSEPLGLYPIVDSAKWVLFLLKQKVRTLQLRIKNLSLEQLEEEIVTSIYLAKKYQARLFINDYWQLAIKHQAYGVHLGQEDLQSADLLLIAKSGLRLGISTHCHYEIARAHAFRPSYIAYGPIYPTTTKKMKFSPRGLSQLRYWCDLLDYRMVAIGGINIDNHEKILATGVEGISVVSAITCARNPRKVVRKFLRQKYVSRKRN